MPPAATTCYQSLTALISPDLTNPDKMRGVIQTIFHDEQVNPRFLIAVRKKMTRKFIHKNFLDGNYYETLRKNKVIDTLGLETQPDPLFNTLWQYIGKHLPYKRGERTIRALMLRPYVSNQEYYYTIIFDELRKSDPTTST